MFLFKIATFTYKVVNEKENLPSVYSDFISLASICHVYNMRFASKQNFSRPHARTNYGKFTFKFVSSKIWESIDYSIKQSITLNIFKKRFKNFLLLSQD
jgi:hypothetical protein